MDQLLPPGAPRLLSATTQKTETLQSFWTEEAPLEVGPAGSVLHLQCLPSLLFGKQILAEAFAVRIDA